MLFLNIVGVSGISTTIQLVLVFMKAEKEADYLWALSTLYKAFKEDLLPKIMLIDCELAFINTINKIFSTTSFFLYR